MVFEKCIMWPNDILVIRRKEMDLMKLEGKNYMAFLYHLTALRSNITLKLILSRLITSILFCT